MESVDFCGRTCHTVMQPEYTAHRDDVARARPVRRRATSGRARLVRALEALRLVPGAGGRLRPLSAPDPGADREPAPVARHLRAVPLARALRRRQARREDALRRRGARRPRRRPCSSCTPAASTGSRASRSATTACTSSPAPRSTTGRPMPRRQEIPYVRYRRPDGEVVEYVVAEEGPAPARRAGRERAPADGLPRLSQPADAIASRRRARRSTRRWRPASSTGRCRSSRRSPSRRSRRPTTRTRRRRPASARTSAGFYGARHAGVAARAARDDRRGGRRPSPRSTRATSSRRCGSAGGRTPTTSVTRTSPAVSAATTGSTRAPTAARSPRTARRATRSWRSTTRSPEILKQIGQLTRSGRRRPYLSVSM